MTFSSTETTVTVRPIELDDCDICALTSLMNQWDDVTEEYSKEYIENRIIDIKASRNAEILVAETEDNEIIGYTCLTEVIFLGMEPFIELQSILVDEKHRGKGVGHLLVKASEKWSRDNGFKKMVLSSRVQLEKAHQFYKNLDFKEYKQSIFFSKDL